MLETTIAKTDSARWLKNLLAAVVVFNMFDAALTLLWIQSGKATEANPLLAELVHTPVSFVLVKSGLVGLGTVLLWRHRDHSLSIAAIVASFFAYYVVLIHHIQGFFV